ncbi:phosphoribosylanthranilate isomerase [Alicyclobacillus fastidiosus]|uniref:N-(5'-phosphoribosyl)anthranilate isomerase n=1 Tax=Alicyclobacillus fastidiosus TaxID=392011 RepID=A0ABY6Z9Y8_9BACL|nr:phosphoribosylanthranilate isomerase [Alicyclobacillus fastidiosus]WAH39662.1 phosphoribosylanthranilate isomerase [Alicyclobacillus fastidiosus]
MPHFAAGGGAIGGHRVSAPEVQVKICGLQPDDELSFTEHPRVSHVGFVFVEASKRFVHPSRARRATVRLAADTEAVGVFANATVDEIASTVAVAGLDIAQLHGDESPEVCRDLQQRGFRVWKAIQVPSEGAQLDDVRREVHRYATCTDAILLDAKPPTGAGVTGGHGQSFDWTVLGRIAQDITGHPWFVAGGIRPDNVGTLLSLCRPTGIDVSSGVERGGRKDPALIQSLLTNVHRPLTPTSQTITRGEGGRVFPIIHSCTGGEQR